MIVSGVYPFGTLARGQGDYVTQYLAFHAQFGRILRGDDLSDFLFSWTSGAGVPVFGDITNYVGGPFPFLIALFPPHLAELGLTTMVLTQCATAGALMAVLLRKLQPGSFWAAAAFGALYGSSAWVFEMAIYTPMWLGGLIAFPLVCLVGMYSVERRHALLSVLGVALVLWSNYYTSYMAILGGVLFFVTWLLATATPVRVALRGTAVFALRGVLGALLAAPVLVPTALILLDSTSAPSPHLRPYPLELLATRLLPGTSGVAYSPALFAGSLVLLLAGAALFGAGSVRRRVVWWSSTALLLVFSALSTSLVLVWSAFVSPHGNAYRYAFVLVGWLIAVAWQSLWEEGRLRSPSWAQLAVAAVVLSTLLAAMPRDFEPHLGAYYKPLERIYLDPSLLIYPLLALGALFLFRASGRWSRSAAVVLLAIITLTETALNANWINEANRDFLASSERFVITARESLPAAQEVQAASEWPRFRAGAPSPTREPFYLDLNLSARDRFAGVSYSSSMMPRATSAAFIDLGMHYASAGRMVADRSGSVGDAIFSIRARHDFETATTLVSPALPLVRTYDRPAQQADSPFAARENLLPEPIYHQAQLTAVNTQGRPVSFPNRWEDVPPKATQLTEFRLTATCPTGDVLSIDSRRLEDAELTVAGDDRVLASNYHSSTGIQEFPARGPVEITLSTFRQVPPPADAFKCHDSTAFEKSLVGVPAPEEIIVRGRTLFARFSDAQRGTITVATAANPGWHCALDGAPVGVQDRQGFLAVPADGQRELSCAYTQPGLSTGLLIGLLGLLGLAAYLVLARFPLRRGVTKADG